MEGIRAKLKVKKFSGESWSPWSLALSVTRRRAAIKRVGARSLRPLVALSALLGLVVAVVATLAGQVQELDTPTQLQQRAEALGLRLRIDISRLLSAEGSALTQGAPKLSPEQRNAIRSLPPGQLIILTVHGELLAAQRGAHNETLWARVDPRAALPSQTPMTSYLLSDRGNLIASRAPTKSDNITLSPALRKAIVSENQKSGFIRLTEKKEILAAAFFDIPNTNLTIVLQNNETKFLNAFLRHSIATWIAGGIIITAGMFIFITLLGGRTHIQRQNLDLKRSRLRQLIQLRCLRNLQLDLRTSEYKEECLLAFAISVSHLDIVHSIAEVRSITMNNDTKGDYGRVISFVRSENNDVFSRIETASPEQLETLRTTPLRVVERLHDRWRCWLLGPQGPTGLADLMRRHDKPETAAQQLLFLELLTQALSGRIETLPSLESRPTAPDSQAGPEDSDLAPTEAMPTAMSIKIPQRGDLRIGRLGSRFEEESNTPKSHFEDEEQTQAIDEESLSGGRAA